MYPTANHIYSSNSDIPNSVWYARGCYRKEVLKVYKSNFRATKALTNDLEYLFLKGFEKDGAKKGKNKYTPAEALVFLQNLTTEDGRRKYSDRDGNPNGPLPTKQYIQSFFTQGNRRWKQKKSRRQGDWKDN